MQFAKYNGWLVPGTGFENRKSQMLFTHPVQNLHLTIRCQLMTQLYHISPALMEMPAVYSAVKITRLIFSGIITTVVQNL
jgi:hypothetical protein